MSPFDPLSFTRIRNYSKVDADNQAINSQGKLPLLYEEDGSRNKPEDHQVEHEPLKNFHGLDALFFDNASPFRLYETKMRELSDIESQYSELIIPNAQSGEAVRCETSGPKISTDMVIRLGGERFVQACSSTSLSDVSISGHPYSSSFAGLSDQEVKDVQLVENLLLSAEKVTQQQFERSVKLLDWCDAFSSNEGNPIQRLVHYFSKALREKIDNETGRISIRGLVKKQADDMASGVLSGNRAGLVIYEKMPFYQAAHFSGVQALVDGLSGSKRVHVIDLSIKQGVQCTILMQALLSQPNSPIEHLKVTAVATNSKPKIEQTGDWLKSFAESINLSFSFNAVIVDDMLDLNNELLELDPDDALGVCSIFGLWPMIAQQDRLEHVMKVMKSGNPRVMVVCEVAACLNSPNFVNRFIEGLFYYGALFDALEECMGREDESRTVTESVYFGTGIKSVVAAEGAERVIRHVNIDVWRKFNMAFNKPTCQVFNMAFNKPSLIILLKYLIYL